MPLKKDETMIPIKKEIRARIKKNMRGDETYSDYLTKILDEIGAEK
jgi:hypothetical protein